ncbi:MAG TPA: VOC family protein [Bryobacteraceae bacterium]|nr:VOC family protein [Bryobacteraceae bacterium]
MRKIVAYLAFFAAGITVGAFLMQPGRAQTAPVTGLRLNHVGIYAKDFDESMRFYTQVMGFHEAFTIKNAEGKPVLAYLQITRDTFLELAPSTADRPVGLSHIGIWPENQAATVAALRSHGIQVADPRVGSTKTSITSITDPNGVRLELVDFLAGSLPRKAIDEWKQ